MKLSQIGNKIDPINEILENFLDDAGVTCAILCDMGGEILTTKGDVSTLDFTNIAAMAAGSYATTKGIANLLGQSEFSLLFHQGTKNNILISSVENFAIFIILFDANTILGVVKQKSQEMKETLKIIFEEIVKGKGIVIKKAKVFEERDLDKVKPSKKKPKPAKKEEIEKEETEEKDGSSKKFDFDSLMIDDLDDIF